MAVQAQKKKDFSKRMSNADLRKEMGLEVTESDLSNSSADKPMDWLIMPPAFENALKLPGLPLGYVNTICGHSDTGKSTLVNCAMAAAQRQGFLPVIFDTENNFDFSYARDCGFQSEDVWGDVEEEVYDEETGEYKTVTTRKVINHDGEFLYYNQTILANRYGNNDYSTGKVTTKKRKRACIEDIVACMNELMDKQDEGKIQQGIVFLWDSVGTIPSMKSINSKVGNNQFDAGAIASAFMDICSNRIPASKKVSSPYTNTFILVNKVWLDSMSAPVGPPSLKLKGGGSIFYWSRLIIVMGGILTSGVKRLKAIAKGEQYNYGIETKIQVRKNQLPTPYNVTYEGTLCCVTHGIVSPFELDAYKKKYMPDMLRELHERMASGETGSDIDIEENDVTFTEVDESI